MVVTEPQLYGRAIALFYFVHQHLEHLHSQCAHLPGACVLVAMPRDCWRAQTSEPEHPGALTQETQHTTTTTTSAPTPHAHPCAPSSPEFQPFKELLSPKGLFRTARFEQDLRFYLG